MSMTTETNEQEKDEVRVVPCCKCGSDDVAVLCSEYGKYWAVNTYYAYCKKCGHKTRSFGMATTNYSLLLNNKDELKKISDYFSDQAMDEWNDINDPENPRFGFEVDPPPIGKFYDQSKQIY